jgi:hypothetical protein
MSAQDKDMNGNWKRRIPDEEVARIAADINRQGYGVLSGYIEEEELEPLRSIANAAVLASGGEYVCFTGPDALAGTVLSQLPQSTDFKNLCRRLYELAVSETAPEVEFYQIFRCLQGATGQRHSYRFHYDSYVVTALLPVEIPKEGLRGDLLVIPGTRRIRRWYLSNVLDKLIVDNKVAQTFLRTVTRHRSLNTVAIEMQPGNMYFFWGYRSVHTNEPCDPDKLRATALFHYGDPHRDSNARALIRKARGHALD